MGNQKRFWQKYSDYVQLSAIVEKSMLKVVIYEVYPVKRRHKLYRESLLKLRDSCYEHRMTMYS